MECETKEYEHYAAYRCVESEQPNFHLPEYFEKKVKNTIGRLYL